MYYCYYTDVDYLNQKLELGKNFFLKILKNTFNY